MTVVINGTTGIDTVQDGIITNAKIASMAATKLTGQVPDANAPSGSVIQVVSTTKTDGFSSNVNGFVDVTGLSVSITPSNSSNRILVIVNVPVGSSTNGWFVGARILRNSTPIAVGDTAGSRAALIGSHINSNNGNDVRLLTAQIFDTPNTTSSITYKVQAYAEGTGTYVVVNRTGLNADNNYNGTYASTITVMEIAA